MTAPIPSRVQGPGLWCGTEDGYVNHGCRCDPCTWAHASYRRGDDPVVAEPTWFDRWLDAAADPTYRVRAAETNGGGAYIRGAAEAGSVMAEATRPAPTKGSSAVSS